jgi:hypothetical protein
MFFLKCFPINPVPSFHKQRTPISPYYQPVATKPATLASNFASAAIRDQIFHIATIPSSSDHDGPRVDNDVDELAIWQETGSLLFRQGDWLVADHELMPIYSVAADNSFGSKRFFLK